MSLQIITLRKIDLSIVPILFCNQMGSLNENQTCTCLKCNSVLIAYSILLQLFSQICVGGLCVWYAQRYLDFSINHPILIRTVRLRQRFC